MVSLLLLFACTGRDTEDNKEPLADETGGTTDTADPREDSGDSGGDTSAGPADADGDGYTADADCDDTDASVHPGAADACDGVDRNCDGDAVDEGGCGEVTEIADTSAMVLHRDYGYFDVDAVWSPTGGDVVVDQTALEAWTWGGYAAYRWGGETFDYALSLDKESQEVYEHATVIGDFDGDGTDDLAIHGGSTYYFSEVALISGDETRWPSGQTHIDDAAFAVWEGLSGGDGFSEELDAGDVDGDGLVDIVTHAPSDVGEDNGGKSGWLFVLPGRTSGFPTTEDDRALTEEWYYPHSRDSVGRTPLDEAFTIQAVHPDLDGDGLADLIAHGDKGWYAVVPGANLVSMQGAYIEDIVEYQAAPNADYTAATAAGSCSGMDFDDDGVMDCLFTVDPERGADTGINLVIVSGAGVAVGAEVPSAALVTIGPVDAPDAHLVRDVDLDGLADIGFSPDQGIACLAVTSRLPLSGTLAAEDIAPCWYHSDDEGFLADVAVGDFDASGVPDLLLPQRPYEWGRIATYMLLDLALPWDDPTRW